MLLSPKGFLRLASASVGLMLFIVGCIGFNTLKLSVYAIDSQAEFGCLCFLGVCFGLLLTFGESKWELFFFFFGFMRYRLGRACIFAVSGVMTALLGKTRDQQCDCSDNVLLVVEGVALLAMAVLQTLAIFVFGNNSAPCRNKDSIQSIRLPAATPLPTTAPRNAPLPKETASFQAVVQPIPIAPIPVTAPPVQPSPVVHDSNLPSWMHTP
ncbi:hypothetical protein KRP22_006755 [Phytophthora ramorum]|uniref:Uncharacterized protein n=1 Tax=Phytophthora ramorum TaxID=164328 RepID=H3H1I8_PHYRM|nr:hypothetical protein KRP23_4663 [Phytophthora ramorum]KAH7507003.1 hypothetical protein KRP22_2114 [Phytophthora ramorum]